MAYSSQSYVKMILSLLPSGLAWPKEPGTTLYSTVEALAQELERIDGAGARLLKELDPRTTNEMLEDWERLVGLPSECSDSSATVDERREQVVSILSMIGGISRQFYIDLAAALGYEISIYEYRPFRAGLSSAGDPVSNGDWVYAWRVDAPENTVRYFKAGGNMAGDALAKWSNDTLECVITKLAPAETIVLFSYGG